MASLEVLLGVAAAVVLVGVLAVRVSVRLGLPSLLLYLGIGLLLGESVLGIQFSDAALTESLGLAALVLILTEGGLTTRWTAVRPGAGRRHRAVHGGRGGEHRGRRGGAAPAARPRLAASRSSGARCCRPPTRRPCSACCAGSGCRRRLSGALELESGMNDAPVVLAVVLLASGDPITWIDPAAGRSTSSPAGGLIGAAVRAAAGRGRCAGPRCPSTGLYPLAAHRRSACWPTPPASSLHASGPARHLRRRAGARQLRPAAPRRRAARSPRGWAGSPRSGCSCCSGSTPRRPGWSTRCVPALIAGAGAAARGAAAVGAWPRRAVPACRGGSRRSCPGPGCAGRCRSCWP